MVKQMNLQYYNLGAAYCRKLLRQGGACIFVNKKLKCLVIKINKFCKEQDPEACAVELQSSACNICILSIYRAPSGNSLFFLSGLDAILKALFNNNRINSLWRYKCKLTLRQ
jgi:hypothetical protein